MKSGRNIMSPHSLVRSLPFAGMHASLGAARQEA